MWCVTRECQKMSQYISHEMSWNAKRYQIFHAISGDVIRCEEIKGDVMWFKEMLKDVMSFHEMWPLFTGVFWISAVDTARGRDTGSTVPDRGADHLLLHLLLLIFQLPLLLLLLLLLLLSPSHHHKEKEDAPTQPHHLDSHKFELGCISEGVDQLTMVNSTVHYSKICFTLMFTLVVLWCSLLHTALCEAPHNGAIPTCEAEGSNSLHTSSTLDWTVLTTPPPIFTGF